MAKSNTIQVKLVSTAKTGFFYVKDKNPKQMTEKLELKKYDHSILQLEKSLKINPNYHQGYNSLGNVYFKKNDFQ